jgi:hypothetical protein
LINRYGMPQMTPITANRAAPRLLNRHPPSWPGNICRGISRHGEVTVGGEYSWYSRRRASGGNRRLAEGRWINLSRPGSPPRKRQPACQAGRGATSGTGRSYGCLAAAGAASTSRPRAAPDPRQWSRHRPGRQPACNPTGARPNQKRPSGSRVREPADARRRARRRQEANLRRALTGRTTSSSRQRERARTTSSRQRRARRAVGFPPGAALPPPRYS